MAVTDLSRVHRAFIEQSDRFKATWTFHQFLEGVRKIFPQVDLEERGASSLPALYEKLKQFSQSLNSTSTESLGSELARLKSQLDHEVAMLTAEDNKVDPTLVRQFFGRVKNYDQKILLQLLRFYIYSHRERTFEPMTVDKIDYVLTRLADEMRRATRNPLERDPAQFTEVLQGLWRTTGREAPPAAAIAGTRAEFERVRARIRTIATLDELNATDLINEYRGLKHRLAGLLFEPHIAIELLETNVSVRSCVERLYQMEEQRIHQEYRQISDVEQRIDELDPDTARDLQALKVDVLRLDGTTEARNVRLDDIADLSRRVGDVLERMRGLGGSAVELTSTGDLGRSAAEARRAAGLETGEVARDVGGAARLLAHLSGTQRAVIEEPLRHIASVLAGTDPQREEAELLATDAVRRLRLLARDIVAYRRLAGDEPCDREIEYLVVDAAALRLRISSEAEQLVRVRGRIGELAPEVLMTARDTCRLADLLLHQFDHHVALSLAEGRFRDSQSLQHCRMRLLRDYSGLWLLAFGEPS